MTFSQALAHAIALSGGTLQSNPTPTACRQHANDDRWNERLRDGTGVVIRAIRSQDAALERSFIERLSPQSRRFRFLGTISTPGEALLEQLVDIDPSVDVALIALIADGTAEKEIGVARLSANDDSRNCEFAVTVSDEWQQRGLGTLLMQHLIDSALAHGLTSIYSIDAADNNSMREFAGQLGFHRKPDPDDSTQVIHSLDLKTASITKV